MPVGLVDYIIYRMSSIFGTTQRLESTAWQKGVYEGNKSQTEKVGVIIRRKLDVCKKSFQEFQLKQLK